MRLDLRRLRSDGNVVGEGPVWCERTGRLFWVDICGKCIHTLTPATGGYSYWAAPDLVTSIGLTTTNQAVVGLRRNVALWDFGSRFLPLVEVEPDLPDNRLNEGRIGPDGAFWIGTMQNNITALGTPKPIDRASGAFYRIWPDGSVEALTGREFGICNTMVWTEDGDFICADTLANQLYSYRFGPDGLSDRVPFREGFDKGLPDGSAIDVQGFVWNARVGGGCVVRFTPHGDVDRVVDLPCTLPTSCVFGGPDLRSLFITSARFGLETPKTDWSNEGALFVMDVDVPGLAGHRFGQSASVSPDTDLKRI